jgi:RNA polymerase sigma-B factor
MRGSLRTTTAVSEATEIFDNRVGVRPDVSWSDLELFRALNGAGDAQRERIQDLIVRRHAGLVRWLAAQYANPVVDADELRQVGYLGLVLAIRRFDPERGCDFISFARPTVQGELRRHFRDKRRWIRMPRQLQEAKAVLHKSVEIVTQQVGRHPTVAELAKHSHLSVELVREAMDADDSFTAASLDAQVSNDGNESFILSDVIGAADQRLELFINCSSLGPLIAELSERDRRILHMRFYEEKSQRQIGGELGISQMQVSRLLSTRLAALRQALAHD